MKQNVNTLTFVKLERLAAAAGMTLGEYISSIVERAVEKRASASV